MSPTTEPNPPSGWEVRERPPLLFRRFEFESYSATRAFLDALEVLSKEQGYYPDLSFAPKYANVTVQARDGKALTPADFAFAEKVSTLVTTQK